MPKVFISHSNQDHESTLFVIDSLRRAGFDVWVDFENIRGGDDWLCEIQAGIARCDAVVTILSQASTQSVWVERECLFAFQLKKPLLTALVADVLIPLHLINIQYCDLREQASSGMVKLVESLETLLTSVDDSRDYPVAALSRQPLEANFFPYLEQLPTGDVARMVAQDLFYWARRIADEVAFGGRSNPGFHTRIMVNGKTVTVFTIWAYRKTPSVQLPLDYLSRHAPFHSRATRRTTLKKLNRLLPRAARFAASQADRRPTFPLPYLSSAENLEDFKGIVLEIIEGLRGADDDL